MLERALQFIEEHGEIIKDQSNYLKDNDWTVMPARKDRKDEHDLHLKIVRSFLNKIKYVEEESGEDFYKDRKTVNFAKRLKKEIENYIDRCNLYFKKEKWTNYEDSDAKTEEMDFQNTVLDSLIKRKEEISKVSLDNKGKDVKIETWGDSELPICLRELVEERYPDVKDFIENRRLKNGSIQPED